MTLADPPPLYGIFHNWFFFNIEPFPNGGHYGWCLGLLYFFNSRLIPTTRLVAIKTIIFFIFMEITT